MRTGIGWGLGLLVFFGLSIVVEALLRKAGIATYIDFGETITVTRGSGRYSYDEDISGASTMVGYGVHGVALILAIWLGRIVVVGPKKPLFDQKTDALGLALLVFSVSYGGLGVPVVLMADSLHQAIISAADLAIAAASFFLARKVYLHQLSKNAPTADAGI